MVHYHVTLAQGGEDVLGAFAFPEGRVRSGNERLILELRSGQRVKLPQAGQVEQAGHLDDVTRIDVQLA